MLKISIFTCPDLLYAIFEKRKNDETTGEDNTN